MGARSLVVSCPSYWAWMPLPCPGLVVGSRCQGPRGLLHTRRPLLPKSCAPAVAQLVSPTTSSTPIDHDFLNNIVFVRGIEVAKSVELISCLAAGAYHLAGDLLDANPDTIRKHFDA